MSYKLNSITIRTNNSIEGMKKIDEVWKDITSGKLPILFDTAHCFQQGISPVSQYSNYDSDENGDYDLSILGVSPDFFDEIEKSVHTGKYKKYDASDDDLAACAKKAWTKVWEEQKVGKINREFSTDYESTVPAEFTKDGKAHCYLYIAVVNGLNK